MTTHGSSSEPGGRDRLRLAVLALILVLASGWRIAFAAPAPVPAPNRAIAPEGPPPIIFSPQITVPPALPPAVTVQVPEPNPLKTWLPVGVAIFSAAVAAFSAWLARRNQDFAFRKDRAAIVRDHRARQAEAGLLAYENNVARPVGAVLDVVERMMNDVSKIRPVPAADFDKKLEDLGLSVMADQANSERLCGEADGALPGNPVRSVFAPVFVRRGIDSLFLAAIREALAGPPGDGFELLLLNVKELKVELRRHLEDERQAEAARWIGDISQDPFFEEIRHLMPRPAGLSRDAAGHGRRDPHSE